MSASRIPQALKTLAVAAALSLAAGAEAGAQAGAQRPEGNYVTVNGVRLYYELHGQARSGVRPLVLLHGGLGAIEMFGPNLPALAAGRQVIAVDLQGHGRTADVDRPLDPALMADDVAALIRKLGHERADVMGYSLGGGVALQTAIRHPAVVGKVVAASVVLRRTAYYPEMLPQQAQVGAAMAEALKPTPMYQLYAAVAPRPEDFPRLLDKLGALMRQDFDYTKDVARIAAPVLVVAGDADMAPPAHYVEIFGLLGGGRKDGGWDGSGRPKSRLAILPGQTHYTLGADPALAAAVIPFLDEGD